MSGMGFFLLIAIASAGSTARSTDQQMDLIELNHFYDEHGRHVFDQVIFYTWSESHRRFHVQAWRLVKHSSQLPVETWNPGGYRCTWHDDGVLRTVRAPAYRETWTQVDPERTNRKLFPQDQRLGLIKPVRSADRKPRVERVAETEVVSNDTRRR